MGRKTRSLLHWHRVLSICRKPTNAKVDHHAGSKYRVITVAALIARSKISSMVWTLGAPANSGTPVLVRPYCTSFLATGGAVSSSSKACCLFLVPLQNAVPGNEQLGSDAELQAHNATLTGLRDHSLDIDAHASFDGDVAQLSWGPWRVRPSHSLSSHRDDTAMSSGLFGQTQWHYTDTVVNATMLTMSKLAQHSDSRAFDLDCALSEWIKQSALSQELGFGNVSACWDIRSLVDYLFGALATSAVLQRYDHVDVTLLAANERFFLPLGWSKKIKLVSDLYGLGEQGYMMCGTASTTADYARGMHFGL